MSGVGGALSGKEAPSLSVPYRYIVTATLALAAFAVLLPLWHESLVGFWITPHLLTLTHLATLGFIGMTITGATLQLVPVALQVSVANERLAGWVFYLYLPGVVALLYGFSTGNTRWLITGGVLVALALSLYLFVMVATLVGAPVEDLVSAHVAAAFAYLTFAALLGVLLALNLRFGFMGKSQVSTLAAHAGIGLAGWFTAITYGVGYKLMGMFTLAEDRINHPVAWTQLASTSAGVLLLGGVGLAGGSRIGFAVAVALILVGAVLFQWQIVMLYVQRRRRLSDIIYPFVLTAVSLWTLAVVLALVAVVSGRPAGHWLYADAVWLGLFGWIGMMILGHMYKINTFLAWLNKYADLVGKQEVPKLDALYEPNVGRVGWAIYALGVLGVAVGIALGSASVVLAASLLFSLGIVLYLVNMVLIVVR